MAENFFGMTHAGKIRDNNEDTFIAEKLANGWILACVIDGVGGYEGGEVAAAIARDTLLEKLQQPAGDIIRLMRDSVLQANQNIYQEKHSGKGNPQMACVLTLALVDVENNQFYYAHVGDTRLYLLRDQSLVKVTKDHSFVGFLEDTGRLSEKEAMNHPKRNEINKALGFDGQIDQRADYIETGSSPFLPGDMLLLCSDGLSDMVSSGEMTSALSAAKSLQQKGEALVDAANQAGGKDNITVVLVRNDKKPLRQRATKPVAAKKNGQSEEEKTATATAENETEIPVVPKKEKSQAAVWILSFICLVLVGVIYWLWSEDRNAAPQEELPVVQRVPGGAEKKLGDSLDLAVRQFLLSPQEFGASITVGDTLFLRQDSLHINGNGIILQSDSAYNGPALLTTVNNRFLSLENIVFKDFKTAVVLQGRGVQLKNVQFINCGTSVQHHLFLPPGHPLTGVIRDTFMMKKDSLPNKP